jgi:hypothetical protein
LAAEEALHCRACSASSRARRISVGASRASNLAHARRQIGRRAQLAAFRMTARSASTGSEPVFSTVYEIGIYTRTCLILKS